MAGISFAVSTIFKSKDRQSKNFNRMGKNAKKFGRETTKAFKSASRSATKFGTITKGILAAGAVQKTLGLVSQGLSTVTGEFISFDSAITQASAKFTDINLASAEGQKSLEKLKLKAREVGRTTKFSSAEAAAGLDFYATAGFKAEQAMAVLAPTARLAMAANLDLARTSDIASDSLGIFGLATKDPIKLQQNFMKMSDQMAKTITSSNLTLEQLFETTKIGGGIFEKSGQSMATFNTFAAALADKGIKAEKSGTGLKAFMSKLAKPTGEAAKALELLGVRTTKGNGQFRDAVDILADFEKGMKDMGNQQKLALTKTIFGLTTMNTFTTLIGTGSEKLREMRKNIDESAGATQKMADIMSKSLENKLLSLKSAAIDVGFQLFEAFGKQGGRAIDSLAVAIRKIDLTPFIEKIKTVVAIAGRLTAKFREFGESSGLFDAIRSAINNTIPLFRDIFDVSRGVVEKLAEIAIKTDIFGTIKESIDSAIPLFRKIVKFGKDVFDRFVKIAEKTGLFDKVKSAITEIVPLFETLFSIVKTLFNLLDNVGVFDALALGAGIILDTVTGLAKTITEIWGVLKPLIEAASKFFSESKTKRGITGFGGEEREKSDKRTLGIIEAQRQKSLADRLRRQKEGISAADRVTQAFKKTRSARAQKTFDIIEAQRQKNLDENSERRAPNQTQLESRATQVDISGRINFQNAPEGTTFTPESQPARNIDFNELGPAGT